MCKVSTPLACCRPKGAPDGSQTRIDNADLALHIRIRLVALRTNVELKLAVAIEIGLENLQQAQIGVADHAERSRRIADERHISLQSQVGAGALDFGGLQRDRRRLRSPREWERRRQARCFS